ncbi:PREDICTED: BTB/POZ domain-containing protein At3g49900 [Ipomoea nil]|uniref:BTB/POZ domain-containing protein At3g49900 n=1 Tax=Ipomoea nil TaxID=35883 RepID=UPI00090166B9|nr:PREDICTED: BTB/POZ domain-containing protein At3g49900 [Ipomoea nil]
MQQEAKVLGRMAAKETAKRGGGDELGFVETIYEEEDEDRIYCEDSASSLSALSPELPSSPSPATPLLSCVNSWRRAAGRETDVVIYVQNSRFHLHKEPLTTRSRYLKRQLKKVSELTLPPPLKITSETFTMLVEFCYDGDLVITPFNVAALRTAAELMEMTCGEGLVTKAENYFRRAVAIKPEYTLILLRSSLSLLPVSETTACLASRCIEALWVMDEDHGVTSCMDDIKELKPKEFLVILESMNQRLSSSHDLLYKLVDLYLKEYNGKMTEEQKMGICNNVNCAMLSPKVVMHAVQNPRMPLRFVVQAMFVEQHNTRRSIVSAAGHHNLHENRSKSSSSSMTLGAVLERDAALRQSAQLKEAMHATVSRIQSLEKELSDMRKFLAEPNDVVKTDSCRSASCRLAAGSLNKIGKGERGSVSSGSFRLSSESNNIDKAERERVCSSSFRILSGKDRSNMAASSSSEWSQDEIPGAAKYNLPGRFIRGLISTFRISKKKPEEPAGKLDGGKAGKAKEVDEDGNVDILVIKKV